MEAELGGARFSAEQLRAVVAPLDDEALIGPAYAAGWSIADVLSHLGSMAVIIRRQLDDVLAGAVTPDDFRQQVWDDWSAKSPRSKANDSGAAPLKGRLRGGWNDAAVVAGLVYAVSFLVEVE